MTKGPPPPPPAELGAITAAIGADATLRLVETYGGTEVYLPKDVNQGTTLALAIGLEPARALSAAFGGQTVLRVPLAKLWRIHLYDWQGEKQRAIARRMGMSENGVWRALRQKAYTGQTPRPNQQPDLFTG